MAVWWMTEALPLAVTSLLPIVLFPLAGVLTVSGATAPYADKTVFLFMGGFMIALAVERWNLHRRIALLTVLSVGTSPKRLVGGIMLATALLSMWISNTATAAMMLPIGMSLVGLLLERIRSGVLDGRSRLALAEDPDSSLEPGPAAHDQGNPRSLPGAGPEPVPSPRDEEADSEAWAFATCTMLGIAYAASIGGMATLIGTPTNLFFAGFVQEQGIPISFGHWMALGVPLSAVLLLLTWIVLTSLVFPIRLREIPGGRELIRLELNRLGRVSRGEWTVLGVFVGVAAAWVAREPLTHWQWLIQRVPAAARLDDTIIAVTGAVLLFIIPVDAKRGIFALDWETARRLPWGVLLLFGGGFSLAAAVVHSRLADWIGGQVACLEGLPPLLLMLAVASMITFLTELTSNTPTAAAFLPILYGVALGIGVDPLLLLVPATIAASCAFMLPVATPPNAIVFGSGYVPIRSMVRAGLWLNLIAIVLAPLVMYTWGVWLFGIE